MSRFGFWHGGGLPKIEFLGYVTQNNGGGPFSSKTFTGVNLGDPASDREIFLTICMGNPAFTPRSISALTIGGVSYSLIGTMPATAASASVSVVSAAATVPSGSSGDITVTFSGTINGLMIGVYRVTGRPILGANHVDYGFAPPTPAVSSATITGIDIPAGGFVLSAFAPYQAVTSISTSGSATSIDASVNVQSSGAAILYNVSHSSVTDVATTGNTISWSWTTNTFPAAAAWVFA